MIIMIKYLGSVGTFIRLNDNEDKTYTLLNIYSSSAANLSLFSAEVNNLSGEVSFNSASTSLYINGVSGSVIPNQQWAHVTFSFDDKLATYDTNNFLIRFGDSASSNFNIQNLYILENSFSASEVGYLHQEFTGGTNNKLTVPPSASYAINIVDYPETNFISASTNVIYQPSFGQQRYLMDINAATESSLSKFVSASVMTNDDLYIDTVNINVGDKVLSLADNQIYELNESSQLNTVSSSVGDVVKVLYGQYLNRISFIKTNSGFEIQPIRVKVNSYLNTIQSNNV
jgi:hypothetical protein